MKRFTGLFTVFLISSLTLSAACSHGDEEWRALAQADGYLIQLDESLADFGQGTLVGLGALEKGLERSVIVGTVVERTTEGLRIKTDGHLEFTERGQHALFVLCNTRRCVELWPEIDLDATVHPYLESSVGSRSAALSDIQLECLYGRACGGGKSSADDDMPPPKTMTDEEVDALVKEVAAAAETQSESSETKKDGNGNEKSSESGGEKKSKKKSKKKKQ
jgi:hypothetical protein